MAASGHPMEFSRLTFDLLPDGVIVVDGEGRIDYANPAAQALFGYTEAELIGELAELLVPTEFARRHAAMRRSFVSVGQPMAMGRVQNVSGQRKDGSLVPLDVTLSRMAGSARVIVYLRDIGHHLSHSESLSQAARRDELTGLLNRRALRQDIEAGLKRLEGEEQLCLLLIDIDQFKCFNDMLGHSAGDELLCALAERLGALERPGTVAYRVGGDEFAFLTRLEAPQALPASLVEAIAAALRPPFVLRATPMHLQASIGYACAPDHGLNAEELMANADMALHVSKQAFGRPQAYDQSYRLRAEHRHTLLRHLRVAVEEGQFELHYQPQYDLASGRITTLEALLRWRHPQWGVLMPPEFLDVLSESELSLPVGAWVLEEACRQVADWNRGRALPLVVAVNVFPRQFDPAVLPAAVRHALDVSGLAPELLEIEITENIAIAPDATAVAMFDALLAMRVSLVLDDFGTGYASLNCLARHPVRKLKIDKSFVDGLATGRGYREILTSIRALAGAMGLDTVVEGVESAATAEMMCEIGFDLGQGYFWSRPLTPADCAELIGAEG